MTSMPFHIALPVTCPKCGGESMVDYPSLVVAVALTRWNQLFLHARCHEGAWHATGAELEKIRQHLGTVWLDHHRAMIQGAPT